MTNRQLQPVLRAALLASASALVLAFASPQLRAADLSTRPLRAPAPPPPTWSWWFEGGLTSGPAGDPQIGFAPVLANIAPGAGYELAGGFDYRPAAFSPYVYSAQFRYGENGLRTTSFNRAGIAYGLLTPTGSLETANVAAIGSAAIKESHWLVDFAVGRDYAIGNSKTQAKLGIRIAELRSNSWAGGLLSGCEVGPCPGFTPVSGAVSFQSRSRFLGVGPRIGVDSSSPLGPSWTFDYMAGVAVLFGDRTLNATENSSLTDPFGDRVAANQPVTLNQSGTAAVLNIDAQAGISYWYTPNLKLTAGYRFDGYFGALKVIDVGGIVNQDRLYHGPMFRATANF
jgi:hypothetical protein